MPMNTTDRARVAGRAAQSKLTPAERSARAAHAYQNGCVSTVLRRWEALTEEQRSAIRARACS